MVHASYEALIRGHTTDGETCDVPGLGPVPVTFARTLAHDALLKTVITKGTDVAVISTDRRYVPAPVRAALIARDRACVVPDCSARHHLQIHHWRTDYAHDGPTQLDNLARLCRPHHDLITYTGWTLTGGPGHWDFRPP
ncbi:MAG TPA: HNH endonuclease signature motif containing protein [Acidimicrobiales bacterium]|nr:HNH endonuclease signature motif containing protein [Acidimicrobiales bacterium]